MHSDTVDQRSHDTSGGEAYSRSQSSPEDPLSIFQGHVAGTLGGKQSEVGVQFGKNCTRCSQTRPLTIFAVLLPPVA